MVGCRDRITGVMKRLAECRVAHGIAGGLIFLCSSGIAGATSGVETSGDILQFVLPAAAAGLTLGYRDKEGALQFGESAALTLGTTYVLKYTVDEKRPNGGGQSFPSAHT